MIANSSSKIPDDIQVKLIVREINEIARRNEEENKGHAGWVIEGFPETAAQAQLLEKALTGLVIIKNDNQSGV